MCASTHSVVRYSYCSILNEVSQRFVSFLGRPILDLPLSVFHLCELVPEERGILVYIGISLIYDGIAFSVTIMRSFKNVISVRSTLITRIFVDGVIYFILIFTYNLIWFIWILSARVRFQNSFVFFLCLLFTNLLSAWSKIYTWGVRCFFSVYDGLTLMGYSTGQFLCKILLLICAIELIGFAA
jgi:hypothetical protein